MLFDNDGSSTDVVNAYTEIFGDGRVMDGLRHKLKLEQVGVQTLEQKEIHAVALKVNECRERKVENETGLVPDFSVPARHYHLYAAAFNLRAKECGMVLDGNGYECWVDDDFVGWYKERYPMLVYKEAARNAMILVNESPLAGAPYRTQLTHGGLIAL
jgi:hypothetical protein